MTFTDPEELRLRGHLQRLSPDAPRVARMQVRVLEGYEARPRSLWLEWVSLLSARPVVNSAWVAAAAAILFLTTPLGLLPRLLPLTVPAATSAAREANPRHPSGAGARPAERRPEPPGRALAPPRFAAAGGGGGLATVSAGLEGGPLFRGGAAARGRSTSPAATATSSRWAVGSSHARAGQSAQRR